MKVQRSSRYIGVAAVALSVVLLPRAFADDSTNHCLVSFYGDGWCDAANNNDQCGYDHGDCCKDSCIDAEFVCGVESPFICRDPEYLDDDSDTSFSFKYSCSDNLIGNGYCDSENNNEGCGYDGGDCCEASCVDNPYVCGEDSAFDCLDPHYMSSCLNDDIGNGYCDSENNNEGCGYDGGDCCEASCVDNPYVCGEDSAFNCLDPHYMSPCLNDDIGNGYCDSENNNRGCGYDGGDCCQCTCTSDYHCGGGNGYQCRDLDAVCVEDGDYVEAGTVTTVNVVANAHNGNSAVEGAYSGCQTTGCVAELTRDGDTDDAESRWSCRQDIVPYEQLCQIIFWLEEPQDVRSVQVAFWESHMYARLLQVWTNGVSAGYIQSSPESKFNKLALVEDNVKSVMLTTSGLDADAWIHILEVRILVEVDDY